MSIPIDSCVLIELLNILFQRFLLLHIKERIPTFFKGFKVENRKVNMSTRWSHHYSQQEPRILDQTLKNLLKSILQYLLLLSPLRIEQIFHTRLIHYIDRYFAFGYYLMDNDVCFTFLTCSQRKPRFPFSQREHAIHQIHPDTFVC